MKGVQKLVRRFFLFKWWYWWYSYSSIHLLFQFFLLYGIAPSVSFPVVKPLSGFPSQISGVYFFLKASRNEECGFLGKILRPSLHDGMASIEPDIVGQMHGSHRVATPQLHRKIDVLYAGFFSIHEGHGLHQGWNQNSIDDETCSNQEFNEKKVRSQRARNMMLWRSNTEKRNTYQVCRRTIQKLCRFPQPISHLFRERQNLSRSS